LVRDFPADLAEHTVASPIRLVLSAWFLLLLIWTAPAIGSAATKGLSDDVAMHPYLNAVEARSDFGMVATGSPEATEAAVAILEHGGNAIDAAVAAALVLGVADSDASGIGGATYMVIQPTGRPAVVIDGTSLAPVHVDIARLREVKENGQTYGYEMVAVPTTLAVLDLALERYGTISMADAVQPAIEVAENGYRLSPIQIAWTENYYDNIMETFPPEFLAENSLKRHHALVEMGYQEVERVEFPPKPVDFARLGGVNAVACDPSSGVYSGVADPRRGGLAMGPRAVVVRD